MKDTVDAQPIGMSPTRSFEHVRMAHQKRMQDAFTDFIGNAESASILEIKWPSAYSQTAAESLRDRKLQISSCMLAPDKGGAWRCIGGEAGNASRSAQRLPYEDACFDWVYCDGIIEHVGNPAEQSALLQELWRVARKGVFVTTQNKRHPIDFGTGLPLLHWFTKSADGHAGVQSNSAASRFKPVRHLLDARMLDKLASSLPAQRTRAIGHVRHLGIKAHFFLMASKTA